MAIGISKETIKDIEEKAEFRGNSKGLEKEDRGTIKQEGIM